MPDLIATRDIRYATRALTAGEPFQASNRDARLLIALKRATLAPASAVPPPAAPPAASLARHHSPSAAHAPMSDALRARAEALGITVDKRWGEKRLNDEITKATKG